MHTHAHITHYGWCCRREVFPSKSISCKRKRFHSNVVQQYKSWANKQKASLHPSHPFPSTTLQRHFPPNVSCEVKTHRNGKTEHVWALGRSVQLFDIVGVLHWECHLAGPYDRVSLPLTDPGETQRNLVSFRTSRRVGVCPQKPDSSRGANILSQSIFCNTSIHN